MSVAGNRLRRRNLVLQAEITKLEQTVSELRQNLVDAMSVVAERDRTIEVLRSENRLLRDVRENGR